MGRGESTLEKELDALRASTPGVGIIGVGFIGRVHITAARIAGARLIGVVDSTPEKSRAATLEFRAEQYFEDVQSLINHPDVDVIHICTPNFLHYPLAVQAISLGKHVVCEKPLAMSASEASDLVRLAEAAHVVAAVPLTYRYNTMAQEARHRILSGQLGAIHVVHGSYLQDWLLSARTTNWRISSEVGGPSRAFADIGTHWCDLAEWMTGQRILELSATIETVESMRPTKGAHTFDPVGEFADSQWKEVGTEDLACLIFRMDGGAVGTLTVSQVAAGRKNRILIEVDGRDGSLEFDQDRPDRLWIGGDEVNQELIRNPLVLSPEARRVSTLPAGHHEGFVDNFAAFFRDVYAAIKSPERPYPSFSDGARSIRLTEAVLNSSADHTWFKVEP
jgi:predicted dehydrogenase